MTSPTVPPDKHLIYITPDELSKLPTSTPVYVLKPENTSGSVAGTTGVTSVVGSHFQNANAVCTSANSSIYHPQSFPPVPTTSTLPAAYSSFPNVPTILPNGVPFSGYNCYPPGLGVVPCQMQFPYFSPYSQTGQFMPCWFQPQLPNANSPRPAIPGLVPPTLITSVPPPPLPPKTIPQFIPSQPPPTILPVALSGCSSVTTARSSLPGSLSTSTLHRKSSSRRLKTEPSKSADPPISQSKPTEPVRYSKLVCAPASEYFRYDEKTGCYHATDMLVDLENRFFEEVVSRRARATAGQEERKPLVRHISHKSGGGWSSATSSKISKGQADLPFGMARSTDRLEQNDDWSVSSDTLDELSCDSEFVPDDGSPLPTKRPRLFGNSTELTDGTSVDCARRSNIKQKTCKNPRPEDGQIGDMSGGRGKRAQRSSKQIAGDHPIGQRSIRQQREVAYKLSHPSRLHPDIWHNEAQEFNDGPACCCQPKYRIGPLHNQYEGEERVPECVQESNNRDRLYHYRVLIIPTTNFVQACPTTIPFNGNDYVFEGFSLFLHYKLDSPPPCQLLRFNLLYDIFPIEEDFPELFTVRALDLITQYVFVELLELLDLSWRPLGITDGCPVVHLMPRFIRVVEPSPDPNDPQSSSKEPSCVGELLPINVVLQYLLQEALTPLVDMMELAVIRRYSSTEWSNYIAPLRGTLTTFPGKKPPAIRVDQMDRRSLAGEPSDGVLIYPLIVHMTFTPMKLSLTREPRYKCVLKNFMKLQYLMMNKPRITPDDRSELAHLASELEAMEHSGVHRREITVELSSEGFYRTGLRPDVSQHAINLVSLISHLRFHKSLESLEARLGYTFKNKSLLHQALTHPSYRRTNFGTNQDHFQNSLVSCGPRIIEYGDKLQLYKAWRKKGLTKMIQVMSVLPKMHEERSNIYGNERLEFLGDAVIEVISSIHLFFMFPELPEGNLDAYRQAIVQNQHLAELAVRLGIHKFLLYTHSVDFCYDSTFIYARSDAFEALMAAIALDAGLDEVDRIFGAVLFGDEPRIHRVWVKIPPHPLQSQCPDGDRSWAVNVPMLKKLPILEENLGINFKHLRVLARAMTIRKTGFNFYTFGDNQRLEFLGDSLLKYVSTDYLFRHFPRHHEGHLSLLKNSLVNKYTQAAVCSELGLDQFVIRREDNSTTKMDGEGSETGGKCSQQTQPLSSTALSKSSQAAIAAQNQNVKYRADLLEAFIGALFVDKDLTWVERFCQVCFWPRLVEFILKQEWNDAKSKLQQCCLTFRSLHEDPEIAHYKVLEHSGPTNQRTYLVGVYFRGQRLATGSGRSVQQAQMEAAKQALELHQDTFRQLDFQRSVISKRYKQPYIEKMLDHVQNWDERLVDYFVAAGNSNSEMTSTKDSSLESDAIRCDADSSLRYPASPNLADYLEHKEKLPQSEKTCPKDSDHLSHLRSPVEEISTATKKDYTSIDDVSRQLVTTSEDDGEEEGEIKDDINDFDSCPSSNSEQNDMDFDSDDDHHSNGRRMTLPSGTLADLLRFRKST
ncbi:ribonuclease III [Clonorchis sinensis]|uniref:Ribonuclease III n=1 Tax=Clonorchis sinensis TaxID=79923 RepID=G7Y6D4_CLOSI|nr:ribonuclease III [Clonorchis sinensis]